MTKKPNAKADAVKVRLGCVYSGDKQSWGIGDVIEVDAEEAARLVALGVAVVV